jgi:hypothetical protein
MSKRDKVRFGNPNCERDFIKIVIEKIDINNNVTIASNYEYY